MSSIIVVISFILDIITSNIFPYMRENLSLLTPLFVPVSIYLIYPYYKSNNKYLNLTIIIGFIYDIFMTNYLPLNSFLFFIIGLETIYINKLFKLNFITLLVFTILIIISYELIEGILLYLTGIIEIDIKEIIYYITNSLLINVIYSLIISNINIKKYRNV